jgi:hypothetical protein
MIFWVSSHMERCWTAIKRFQRKCSIHGEAGAEFVANHQLVERKRIKCHLTYLRIASILWLRDSKAFIDQVEEWHAFQLVWSGYDHGYDLLHTNQANISAESTISSPLIAREEKIRSGNSHFEFPFQNMIGSATITADTRRVSKKRTGVWILHKTRLNQGIGNWVDREGMCETSRTVFIVREMLASGQTTRSVSGDRGVLIN